MMMMERVFVSQEQGFVCVKWKAVFNGNNAFHVKIIYIYWYAALVHNVCHIFAEKNDFSTSNTGLEKEKW